jgi:cytoskeletal protein RodZ
MNRIYDKQEIARMLDKFMAGETSLNEEQMLAEYFRTNEVDDEWMEYKEMFALFDSGKVDIEPETEVAQPVNISEGKVKTLPKDVNTKPKILLGWVMTGIAASILFIIGFYIFNKDGESETQEVLVAQVSKSVEVEKEALPVSTIIEEQQTSSVSQVPNSSKPKKHARHQDALPANHEEASTETADADIAQEMADIIVCLDNFEQQLLSE